MVTTANANHITKPLDDAIEYLRVGTENGTFDAEDLIAQLLVAKSRAERAATAVHLAEKFEHLVRTAPLDACTGVLGRDLARAIASAKGIPSVLVHYQQMARDAQQAPSRQPLNQPGVFNIHSFDGQNWRGGMNRLTKEDAIATATRWSADGYRYRVYSPEGELVFDTDPKQVAA